MSRIILFFSRGGYSHTSVLFDDGTIIEARPFTKIHKLKCIQDGITARCRVDIFEVDTTQKEDAIIKEFLEKQIGKKYDYLAIFGFIMYASKEGRKSYGRWICSELVFAAFRKAGINLHERIDAWKVSPTILSYNTKMILKESKEFNNL